MEILRVNNQYSLVFEDNQYFVIHNDIGTVYERWNSYEKILDKWVEFYNA